MITSDALLSGIPPGLRDPLLNEYRELMTAFVEGRWKSSSLDAGRFCEVAFSVLEGAIAGTFPAGPKKPDNFVEACKKLERSPPVAVGDRSLRILLPRSLPPIYEIRNYRDVGHVGGDVASNKMDATYVAAACTFVLAELVRVFHNCSVADAQRSVDALVERRVALVWDFDGGKRVLSPSLPASDKALLLLYSEADWVQIGRLCSWVKYSNITVFRKKVIGQLDAEVLVEFDPKNDRCQLTPLGIKDVESRLIGPPS